MKGSARSSKSTKPPSALLSFKEMRTYCTIKLKDSEEGSVRGEKRLSRGWCMHDADWASCTHQRGPGTQENKGLLTISAQEGTVGNAMCGTGAAFRRAAATEICLKRQTAQQTAAAGVGQTGCKKVAPDICFSVSKLHTWIKYTRISGFFYVTSRWETLTQVKQVLRFPSDRLQRPGFWQEMPSHHL